MASKVNRLNEKWEMEDRRGRYLKNGSASRGGISANSPARRNSDRSPTIGNDIGFRIALVPTI